MSFAAAHACITTTPTCGGAHPLADNQPNNNVSLPQAGD